MSWLLECGGKQHGWDFRCQRQFNTPNTFVNFFFPLPRFCKSAPTLPMALMSQNHGGKGTDDPANVWTSSQPVLCHVTVKTPGFHRVDTAGLAFYPGYGTMEPSKSSRGKEGSSHLPEAPRHIPALYPPHHHWGFAHLQKGSSDSSGFFPFFFFPEEKNLSKLIFLNI